jgi:hypothetical protein
MWKRTGIAGAIVTMVVGGGGFALGDVPIRTVAVKTDPAPQPLSIYKRFKRPVASDTSDSAAAFFARISALVGGSTNGIFKDDPDAPGSVVVLKGDPGPDSLAFSKFGNPSMNAGGDVAFDAQLSGGLTGVFRGDPDVVALLGDTIPAVTGLLDGFEEVAITDAGDVNFIGTISGAAEVGGVKLDEGIFRCTGGDGNCSTGGTGTLEVLVLRNDDVPDRAGRKFCSFETLESSNFGVVFIAETHTDCSSGSGDLRGVFRLPFGGSAVTVALEGEASEPQPILGGTVYGFMSGHPDIASDGTVVFKSRIGGILIEFVLFRCIVGTCPAAPADALIEQGQVDPEGALFKFFGSPVISDAGDVAFPALARGNSGTVKAHYVYRAAGGTIERIVERGDPVPDRPGATFRTLFVKTRRIHVSAGGTLAFQAKIRSPIGSPPPRSPKGVFVADLSASPSGAFLEPTSSLLD